MGSEEEEESVVFIFCSCLSVCVCESEEEEEEERVLPGMSKRGIGSRLNSLMRSNGLKKSPLAVSK